MRWCGNEWHFMGKKSGKNAIDAGVFQAFFVVQALQKFYFGHAGFRFPLPWHFRMESRYLGTLEWNYLGV